MCFHNVYHLRIVCFMTPIWGGLFYEPLVSVNPSINNKYSPKLKTSESLCEMGMHSSQFPLFTASTLHSSMPLLFNAQTSQYPLFTIHSLQCAHLSTLQHVQCPLSKVLTLHINYCPQCQFSFVNSP